MKQNQKGMTLIEVIVSLLILSTASLMAFSSFSVIIRTMNEGSNIKNSANKIVALIDGNASAVDKKDIITEINTATARLSVGGNTINVHGTAYKGSIQYGSDTSDVVELGVFTTETNKLTPIEQMAYDFKKELQGIIYVPNFLVDKQTSEIFSTIGRNTVNYTNDILRDYLFKYHFPKVLNVNSGWPSFDASKFKFDTNNQEFIDRYKVKLKETYYIQPYFMTPAVDNVRFVLFAKSDNNSNAGWSTNFYFNDDDNHWYYKPDGYYNKDLSWVGFSLPSLKGSTLAEADASWSTVKERMVNVTDPVQDPLKEGWVRLIDTSK